MLHPISNKKCDRNVVYQPLKHLFWRFLAPQLYKNYTSPQDIHIRELCLPHYRELDSIIERVVSLAGESTNVLMTFEHGFAANSEVVYINKVLVINDYLQWSSTTQINGG